MRSLAVAVPVHDPTGAIGDPELPTLALALHPDAAEAQLARVPSLAAAGAGPLVRIAVLRHKPGRRCLIAYELERYGTVLGKIQRRRYGKSGFRLLAALRVAGLDGEGDGIAVPEPLGSIGAFRMWLQREAPGRRATEKIDAGDDDGRLARRIAEAAHKLHRAGVPAERRHGVGDELRILDACLERVAAVEPRLAPRLQRLSRRCARAPEHLAGAPSSGIHRDFYADQVLVDGNRLTLVDFDLYCEGDPALDIGNFLGHVAEQALRMRGDANAFRGFENELEARFGELAGADACARVPVWTALTVARHVYLSTRFEERRALTERLVNVAEERLAEAGL